MNKSTLKQRLLIAHHILSNQNEHKSFKQIAESTPANNKKYHDFRVNYQNYILAEKLEKLSTIEASAIISVYIYGHIGRGGRYLKYARGLLNDLELIY